MSKPPKKRKPITDKERLDWLSKAAKITRIYRGYGPKKMFKTCAWRIVVECRGDWERLRRAIDAAIRAEKGGRDGR